MKKTIIALIVLTGVAAAASDTIVLGGDGTANPWGFGTYVTHVDGVPGLATANYTVINAAQIGASGVTLTMVHSAGRTFVTALDGDWSNEAALAIYNNATGNSLTKTQIAAGTVSAPAAGSSHETITLNFSGSENYQAGQEITIFAFAGVRNVDNNGDNLYSFTITGLAEGFTVSTASATGNGFDNTFSTKGGVTIAKISGVLTEDRTVTIVGNGNKTGFAAITVMPVPEPATATLSLLALVGMAARRRRK